MNSTDQNLTDVAPATDQGDDFDFTDIELADLDQGGDALLVDDTQPGSDDESADSRLREAEQQASQLRLRVAELDRLDPTDLGAQVDFYQRTHTALQDALSDIDNA